MPLNLYTNHIIYIHSCSTIHTIPLNLSIQSITYNYTPCLPSISIYTIIFHVCHPYQYIYISVIYIAVIYIIFDEQCIYNIYKHNIGLYGYIHYITLSRRIILYYLHHTPHFSSAIYQNFRNRKKHTTFLNIFLYVKSI